VLSFAFHLLSAAVDVDVPLHFPAILLSKTPYARQNMDLGFS
jgi:hypothetical protein